MRVFTKKKLNKVLDSTFRKWSEWSPEDFVVGQLLEIGEDTYGKPSYTVEILNVEFQNNNKFKPGSKIILNSNGMLDKAMKGDEENPPIEIGEYIEVVYKGTSIITKGKYKDKESHLIELSRVEVEEEVANDDI